MADGSRYLDFGRELVVDLFAGGGGASHGISRAYREPDVAVNHNPIAIAVHTINHPQTKHYVEDVFDVDPVVATNGKPVGLLWASPDCKHHSKAKGGKPRDKKIRGLAWVVVKWAAAVRPRVICLENVEEFAGWGPLLENGQPCKQRKGETFQKWKSELEALGYVVEYRELIAADYGAPTIRKRLYVVARCDGREIVWPEPTHSKTAGELLPWNGANTCIDWSIPGVSVFGRRKALKPNTLRRICKGMWRYVIKCSEPFVVNCSAHNIVILRNNSVAAATTDALNTISTSGGHHGLVAAHLTHLTHHGERSGYVATDPLRTVTGANRGEQAVVAAFMTAFGQNAIGHKLEDPSDTVMAVATRYALVAAFIEQANGGFYDGDGRSADTPLSTVTMRGTNQRLVTAYMVKYYGNDRTGADMLAPMHTVTTKDRIGLVQVVLSSEIASNARRVADLMREYLPELMPAAAEAICIQGFVITDISLRMLTPRELARAQGFPDSYVIDTGIDEDGNSVKVTKTAQVALIGNSVCPDVAEAIVRANLSELISLYAKVAA